MQSKHRLKAHKNNSNVFDDRIRAYSVIGTESNTMHLLPCDTNPINEHHQGCKCRSNAKSIILIWHYKWISRRNLILFFCLYLLSKSNKLFVFKECDCYSGVCSIFCNEFSVRTSKWLIIFDQIKFGRILIWVHCLSLWFYKLPLILFYLHYIVV